MVNKITNFNPNKYIQETTLMLTYVGNNHRIVLASSRVTNKEKKQLNTIVPPAA